MSDPNNRLVYSTETGCIDEARPAPMRLRGDSVARIQHRTNGRKGRGVCLISGIDANGAALSALAAELKRKCDCGGAVKGGVIEIQDDRWDLLRSLLEAKRMRVKLADD